MKKIIILITSIILVSVTACTVNSKSLNIEKEKVSAENLNLNEENNIPVDICCGAQYDVGFYVAAHLKLYDVAICVYDKDYITAMKKAHKELGIDNTRIKEETPYLSKKLTKYWKVHRLVRVPVYFDNFKDTEVAYDLLLGKVKVNDSNKHVWKVLQNNMLKLYPYLDKFSGEEKIVAEKLVDLIEYEYYHFYEKYFELNKEAFTKRVQVFKTTWQKEYEPALKVLNANSHSLKKVEIILTPALQVHGKSFRVINGIGRVATLLPENNEELQRGLVNAYHEMCHGFSDKIVYKEMNLDRNKMSFKGSEQGSDIHSLIENAADQTMYLGLKYGNPELLNYFFNKTTYGNLSWMLKYNAFKSSFELAGRNLSEKEINELVEKMKIDPVGTSKYIYAKGLLINPKVNKVLLGLVAKN